MKLRYFNFSQRAAEFIIAHARFISHILVAVVLMTSLFQFSGCKHDESSKLETDKVRKMLTSTTWKVQEVTVDDVDNTSMYPDLTLKFTDTQFSTTNGKVVWPESGVWTFADNTGKNILRGDDIEINVEQINTNKLILNLIWATTTLGPGRSSSIKGKHTFTFVK